jgi:hypothetical protein
MRKRGFLCILNADGKERQREEREVKEINKGFDLNVAASVTSHQPKNSLLRNNDYMYISDKLILFYSPRT